MMEKHSEHILADFEKILDKLLESLSGKKDEKDEIVEFYNNTRNLIVKENPSTMVLISVFTDMLLQVCIRANFSKEEFVKFMDIAYQDHPLRA